MSFQAQTLLAALLLLSAAVAAFDVKEILDPYAELSTFTKYLADTKLVDEINSRQTITVLAVDNSAIGPISAVPAAQLKDALSVHVLLDYYDPYIFDRLPNKTALITTLYQASGRAADQNGFLNITELPGERMMLGSAAPGAPHDSELLKVIGAKPYNLSVLQISKAIVPPGIRGASPAAATTPAKAEAPVPAPKASPATPAAAPPKSSGFTPAAAPPKPTNATAPATAAKAPKPSGATPTNAPTGGAKAPAKDPAKDAATPSEGPVSSTSSGPTAATPAEGPASPSSSGPTAADAPAGRDASPPATTEPADVPSSADEATASSSAKVVAGGATIGVAMAVAAIALL